MSDEALRMQAEVQDRFSGPLKALRAQLLDTARTGANHSETLAKGFKAVEGTMQSTARVASSVVNPAFAALGVTGLSAGAAVAGISAALNRLTGNMASLGQLSRETGVAAKTLQEFGSVAGRFGIEQDAVASATKNFAAQMRTFSIGTGEAFNWVIRQGRDASGRKAFQDFATDLQKTTDEGEKLKKALAFMETIRNPVERGIFAQQFFGNQDLGRIADGHLGRVVDLFKKAREKLGEFKPEDIIDAEKFDRSISSLKGSMQRFGTAVARELLGPATDFTTWADSLVSGERSDITKSLREGLQNVKKELGDINWKQAGDDAAQFLTSSTALASTMAKAFHEIAETIHYIRDGNYSQAMRSADGASGPLARKLAPRIGDDEIDARENVDRLRKLRDVSKDASGFLIGRTQQRMGLLDTPEAAQQKLDAAQAELSRLQGRTPEQRQKDFDASEKLRRALDANTEELKASRNGALVQKQSMDTQGGLFGGATIQSAAFGGGFRRPGGYGGGANLPGGGSGPGYGGEQGPTGRVGRFNGLGSRPKIAPAPMPPMGSGGASVARGGLAANQQEAYRAARAEGLSDVAARALVANMSGESLSNPRDHHWDRKHMSQGIVQWDPQRAEAIRRKFGAYPKDLSVTDQTRAAIDEIRSNPRFRRTARALDSDNPNEILGVLVENFEAPQNTKRAIAERQRFYRGFNPNAATAGIERPPIVKMERPQASLADGAGWAAREAARKTFEAQQAEAAGLRASGARVASAASRAGVVAMPQIENNGSVVVNVHKPGPETRVATTASGKLFQDVVQRSGAQMRRAD